MDNKEILLHTCCGPCGTVPVRRLCSDGYKVILYFSNSNIYPEDEYKRRLFHARTLAEASALELIEDTYEHESWLDFVKGFENEPEKGLRCERCFEYNLKKTSTCSRRLGIPSFTTTLTVSRHKPSKVIFRIGEKFPGFEPMDFKKKDGFSRSIQLSRALNLYRQNYCGCEFSMRPESL